MWDKYRHESKQTICVIGFLILAAKLCKADGHFNVKEEDWIDIFNYIMRKGMQNPVPLSHVNIMLAFCKKPNYYPDDDKTV